MKRFLTHKYGWLLALVLLFGVAAVTKSSHRAESSSIGTVTKGELVQRVTIAGTVVPNRKTVISAPYNGYVRKVFVHIGDQVKAADPIISVAQSLRGSSEEIFPLRAPFTGTVVQVLKTEGEYVEQQSSQGGNAMVRIDDLTQMFVEASTPELEVAKVKVGQEVIIKASAILSRSYKGKIQHISLAAKETQNWDKTRVEFPILIEVTDKDPLLKSGMSVIVDIITNKLTDVLTLKHEFIRKDGDKYFVLTERGEKKDIEVGIQNEDVFEIKKGLSEGVKVRQTDFLSDVKAP